MKKRLVLLLLPAFAILQFRSPSKKASAPPVVKSTFEQHVKPLVSTSCAPCHTTGNKSKLLQFAVAKDEADDIIRRVNLTPADKGFMPFKHAKLSDLLSLFL